MNVKENKWVGVKRLEYITMGYQENFIAYVDIRNSSKATLFLPLRDST